MIRKSRLGEIKYLYPRSRSNKQCSQGLFIFTAAFALMLKRVEILFPGKRLDDSMQGTCLPFCLTSNSSLEQKPLSPHSLRLVCEQEKSRRGQAPSASPRHGTPGSSIAVSSCLPSTHVKFFNEGIGSSSTLCPHSLPRPGK